MSFLCHFTLCVPIKSFAIFSLAEKWEKGHKTKALEVVGFFKIYGKSPLSSNKLKKVQKSFFSIITYCNSLCALCLQF